VALDAIFGAERFRNGIVWRTSTVKDNSGHGAKHFGRNTGTLVFYAKTDS
jgi:hypothetical protein